MLTIGVIALIQPIKPTAPYSAFTTALFMAISVLVVYILSKDGELDRKEGALLVIIYGAFLAMQSIIEALGI